MPVEIEAQQPVGDGRALAGGVGIPLADARFVVEEVDRALDAHRPRHTGARHGERRFHRRTQIAHAPDFHEPLDVRLDQGALVDVLQRTTALQRGGCGAAEQDHGRLRELRVLERGDGVGETGTRGHCGDARHAGQSRHRVGSEHRGRLVAHVDDADAARLGRRQDRRDVAAAKGEHEAHTVRRQRRADAIAAMHDDRFHFHPAYPWLSCCAVCSCTSTL